MEHLKYVIEASEAETMAKKLGLKSVHNLLPLMVRSAKKLARTPISNFPVSAVGLSTDGRIFIGVNMEFPGLPLHHTIHAEQFLITNLSFHPETALSHVVVSSYPCGHCRQFLQEIRGAPDIHILVNESIENTNDYKSLSYFLPHRFGPYDLLDKVVPLILEEHDNYLILASGETGELVVREALEAANRSHAPYSNCPSGVAFVDIDGNIYKGSYLESAAYNPSLGPTQTAIIAFVVAHGGGYERIVGAVLVEKQGAIVRQEETVRLFLKTVSEKCEFRVFYCKSGSSMVDVN